MSGPLNLTDFEEVSFDAFDPGSYGAEVARVEMKETKGGEDAALPKGTPMFNIMFKVTEDPTHDGEFVGRTAFGTWIVPPKKIGAKNYEHYKMMNGNLVRLFKSLGYTEEEITSGEFEPDSDDMVGRECTIKVSRYEYGGEMRNKVTGVKPAGEIAASSETGLL